MSSNILKRDNLRFEDEDIEDILSIEMSSVSSDVLKTKS